MKHAIFRVSDCRVVGPYTLRVAFDDGTEQVINFQPVLAGELFSPLRDISIFNQVTLTIGRTRYSGVAPYNSK